MGECESVLSACYVDLHLESFCFTLRFAVGRFSSFIFFSFINTCSCFWLICNLFDNFAGSIFAWAQFEVARQTQGGVGKRNHVNNAMEWMHGMLGLLWKQRKPEKGRMFSNLTGEL